LILEFLPDVFELLVRKKGVPATLHRELCHPEEAPACFSHLEEHP
jgi:hypothetical protein